MTKLPNDSHLYNNHHLKDVYGIVILTKYWNALVSLWKPFATFILELHIT